MGHCATRRTTRFPRCAGERHGQEPPERRTLDIPQPGASEAETHGTGRRAAARPSRRLALLCGVVVLFVGGVRAVAESGAMSTESLVARSTISAGGGEGFGHSCGVRTDGTVVCWGADADGQATPPQGTFTQVSAGGFHTCGVQTQGTVACWGNDEIGQATPPGGTFTQVSAGNSHTCGVQTDGAVACWGFTVTGRRRRRRERSRR